MIKYQSNSTSLAIIHDGWYGHEIAFTKYFYRILKNFRLALSYKFWLNNPIERFQGTNKQTKRRGGDSLCWSLLNQSWLATSHIMTSSVRHRSRVKYQLGPQGSMLSLAKTNGCHWLFFQLSHVLPLKS